MLDGGAVGVADHVPGEGDHAHAGQHRRPGLHRVARALEGLLGAGGQLLLRVLDGSLLVASAREVAVRRQHRRQAAAPASRPVQAAGDPVARHALEGDVLDGVAVARDRPAHDRVQRRPFRPRPHPERDTDLAASASARAVHSAFCPEAGVKTVGRSRSPRRRDATSPKPSPARRTCHSGCPCCAAS